MILNHNEIQELIDKGYIKNHDPKALNATSLDIRLGDTILIEIPPPANHGPWVVDYREREPLHMEEVVIDSKYGYQVQPKEFFLGHSVEEFDLPDDITVLLRIKSSMGRIGLEHMDAGFIDPGFNGVLTLEYINMTRYHQQTVRPGDFVGQLIFFRNIEVDPEFSYRSKGNYNGRKTVTQVGFKDM